MNRLMYVLPGIILLASLRSIAQTGDPWLMKGHDTRRTGQSLTNGPRNIDAGRSWSVEAPAAFVLNIGASVDGNGAYFGSWGLLREDSLGRDRRFWNKSDGAAYGFSLDGEPIWGDDGSLELDFVPTCYQYDGRTRDGNDLYWCGAFNTYNVSYYNGTVEGQGAIDPERGLIYFGRGDGKVYAIEPKAGEIAWRYRTFNPRIPDDPDGGGEVVTSPLIGNDGTIYFGTWGEGDDETNAVYAVNPNGTLKWRWPSDSSLPHRFFASPALSPDGSTLYFATFVTDTTDEADNGFLYAFRTGPDGNVSDDDRLKWAFPLAADGRFTYCATIAVGQDGIVYGGGAKIEGGTNIPVLYAVDDLGDRARLKWGTPYRSFDDGAQFVLGIALRERDGVTEQLYATSANFGTPLANFKQEGKIYAVVPATGAVEAAYDPSDDVPEAQGSMNSPAIGADGTIYVGVRGRYRGLLVPELVDGYYFALDYDSELRRFDRVWSYEVGGYIEWSHPAIGPDGGLYAGSSIGGSGDTLQTAFHPQGTVPPGSTPKFYGMKGSASSVVPDASVSGFSLQSLQPNPASGSAILRYTVGSTAHVRLTLCDALGRTVGVINDRRLERGSYRTSLDISGFPVGTYYCRLSANGVEDVRKLRVWR